MQFGTVSGSFHNPRIWLGFGFYQDALNPPKVFQVSPYKYLDRIFA
jgi:hypothetical protein